MLTRWVNSNMVEINPKRRSISDSADLSLVSNGKQYELNASASNIDGLLHRFVVFIDATPSTTRTYKTSLRQWYKYMYEQGIRKTQPEDVGNYGT